MNIGNALGFLGVGAVMLVVPENVSGFFPAGEASLNDCGALWLNLMGGINVSLGGVLMMRYLMLPQLVRMMAWRPTNSREMAVRLLRPALTVYAELESVDRLQAERPA